MHFIPEEFQDTKYILPSLSLPLIHISTNECNPKLDIITNQPTIKTIHNQVHIYQEDGKYLITLPITTLKWL